MKYGDISLVLCISTRLRLVTILSLLVKYLVILHADPCNKSYIYVVGISEYVCRYIGLCLSYVKLTALHLVIVKYGDISLVLCISTRLRLVTILSLLVKYLVILHADPCNKSYIYVVGISEYVCRYIGVCLSYVKLTA